MNFSPCLDFLSPRPLLSPAPTVFQRWYCSQGLLECLQPQISIPTPVILSGVL